MLRCASLSITLVALICVVATGVADDTAAESTRSAENDAMVQLPPSTARGFLYKTIEFEGATYSYSVYVPPNYAHDQAWPVVLFLHGSGERGSDGFRQTMVGLPAAIRRNYTLCPAIVVMPQCPRDEVWTGPMALMAAKTLEQTSTEYRIDRDRVYISGLSLGGAGTWYLAAKFPNHFAAAGVVCGFGDASWAANVKDMPIWCVHGLRDDVLPVEKGREMVQAVRAAGGSVHYVEIPDGNHNVWDATYNDPAFWNWLLAQRRGTPATPPTSAPANP